MEIPMKSYVFKHVENLDISLDFYPSQNTSPAPLIVWIHGGALMMGTRRWMHPVQRQLLHEAGFAQASIDYRLAPEAKLPKITSDIRDAFHWLEQEAARLNIDAARLGVLGHSAGGYLSLMAGCCLGLRPKAIAAFYGYGDIIGDWYAKPDPFYCQQPLVSEADAQAAVGERPIADAADGSRGTFYLFCRQQGLWPKAVLDVDPHENPEAFFPYCPVRNVTADFPPTLLLHGTADTDVPYEQSVMMADALAKAGVTHELVTIPDGAHSFDNRVKPEHLESGEQPEAVAALRQVVTWFGKHV